MNCSFKINGINFFKEMSDIYHEKARGLIVLSISTTLLRKWKWAKTFSDKGDHGHTDIQRVLLRYLIPLVFYGVFQKTTLVQILLNSEFVRNAYVY